MADMMPAQLLSTYRCAEAVSEANRAAGWAIEYRQLKTGRYRSHFGMRELTAVLVAVDSFESLVEITGQPPRDLVMIAVPLGDQPAGILSRGRTLTSHCVDLIDANSECDWIVPSGTRMGQIYVSRETIRETYRRLYKDELPENLNVLVPTEWERDLIGPLQSMITRVLLNRGTRTEDETLLSQRIVELCARIVASRTLSKPKRESIGMARRHRIYVGAREYIDGNLGRSISISDICEHVGASVSTLERVFQRTTGLPPRTYIRSRRMNEARHLLLTHGAKLTVAQVAMQCGLPHFGRFARSYRSYFGQLPSQTT